jgi:hypothetical protein
MLVETQKQALERHLWMLWPRAGKVADAPTWAILARPSVANSPSGPAPRKSGSNENHDLTFVLKSEILFSIDGSVDLWQSNQPRVNGAISGKRLGSFVATATCSHIRYTQNSITHLFTHAVLL